MSVRTGKAGATPAGGASMKLVDLHTHSLLSDGLYLPMELARRAECRGYRWLAITDHVDASNLERVIPEVLKAAAEINRRSAGFRVIPGAEVTHAPAGSIAGLVDAARRLGARLVLVHGETLAEPVVPGTNRAAIEAGPDILAHPGLIDAADYRRAAEKGVRLEISARKGHCLANGHLVQLWRRHGGRLVIDTDGHQEDDLFTEARYLGVGRGAGLTEPEVRAILKESLAFAAGRDKTA
ncbi:MAG: DNA polymerase/3'-5' exonuclease PolX [candidate division TA06 bacterium ADurb.Bin417]|uniref:DNA polymerase/3'-5' exonuclease PolX n=1 Tax=candidate division TA06 bacterium ADurb.Bin417 TaxID=1852828 RepID=A0A1V5MKD5_UNCT6|nr:MAG: DNA polymerase/3'-5' exonuclease PolX [candidate division TA06 bacterium ADurb.Bin417]